MRFDSCIRRAMADLSLFGHVVGQCGIPVQASKGLGCYSPKQRGALSENSAEHVGEAMA